MKRAQARLVEMLLAVFIIVTAYITVQQIFRPFNVRRLRDIEELRAFGYNILDELASSRLYENIIVKGILNNEPWEDYLKVLLEQNLPPDILYSLEVYNLTVDENYQFYKKKLNTKEISNIIDFDQNIWNEVAIIEYVYTTIYEPKRGWTLVLILKLARPG